MIPSDTPQTLVSPPAIIRRYRTPALSESARPTGPNFGGVEAHTPNESNVLASSLLTPLQAEESSTTLLSDLRGQGTSSPREGESKESFGPPQHEDPRSRSAESINEQRLELLARRYVKGADFSAEEGARLRILSARVRQLFPRIVPADYEAITRMRNEAEEIRTRLREIRSEFELD